MHSVDFPDSGNPGRRCVALGTNPDRLPREQRNTETGHLGDMYVRTGGMHARRVDGYFDHRTGHASRMAYCGQFVAENEKTPICVDADRGLNSSVGAEGFEPPTAGV
ncbi:MAG: hypothetical protein K0Q61_3122 [Rhodococcus erythropolis]|nr:hypothetical protein [Rhodococcus erythropolis]